MFFLALAISIIFLTVGYFLNTSEKINFKKLSYLFFLLAAVSPLITPKESINESQMVAFSQLSPEERLFEVFKTENKKLQRKIVELDRVVIIESAWDKKKRTELDFDDAYFIQEELSIFYNYYAENLIDYQKIALKKEIMTLKEQIRDFYYETNQAIKYKTDEYGESETVKLKNKMAKDEVVLAINKKIAENEKFIQKILGEKWAAKQQSALINHYHLALIFLFLSLGIVAGNELKIRNKFKKYKLEPWKKHDKPLLANLTKYQWIKDENSVFYITFTPNKVNVTLESDRDGEKHIENEKISYDKFISEYHFIATNIKQKEKTKQKLELLSEIKIEEQKKKIEELIKDFPGHEDLFNEILISSQKVKSLSK